MNSVVKLLARALSNVGALITEPLSNNLVFQGKVFTVRRVITIPSGNSELIFDPTVAVTPFVAVLPPIFTANGGDQVEIDFYVGATYTGGTVYNGVNRSQTSSNTAGATVVENPTVLTPGVRGGVSWLVPSNSGFFGSTGASAISNLPFNLDKTLAQRLAINNTDAAPQTLEYNITWFEL